MGAQQRTQSPGGYVGVGGNFGFGTGVVPGLDVGVGWGVGIGPFPWFGDIVGADLLTGVGVLGSTSSEEVLSYSYSDYCFLHFLK